jgi:vancomycin resistance protein YoaR
MHRNRMTSWIQVKVAGAAVDWTAVSAEVPEPVEEVL